MAFSWDNQIRLIASGGMFATPNQERKMQRELKLTFEEYVKLGPQMAAVWIKEMHGMTPSEARLC